MKKKTQRKYRVYNALVLALRKDGFVHHGALATYLMDMFLEGKRTLYAEQAVANKFCGKEPRDFSTWRERLIECEWLSYDHAQAIANKTIGKCEPGRRLQGYLNKEKILSEEIVTQRMLTEQLSEKVDNRDFEELKLEVEAMKEGLFLFMGSYLKKFPPDTPARRAKLWTNFKKGIVGFTEADEEEEQKNHPDYRGFIKS